MAKTEPWPVRLTIDGFDKAGRLMSDFGYRSRDVFAAHAMEALAAVKAGKKLPGFIDEARQRHLTIMMQRATKEQNNAKEDSPEKAERFFAALSDGGQIQIPLLKTFFAARYGIVVDRFGISWKIMVESKAKY